MREAGKTHVTLQVHVNLVAYALLMFLTPHANNALTAYLLWLLHC